MLYFITEQHDGEPDLLSLVKHHTLTIRDANQKVILSFNAPGVGWSHERLVDTVDQSPEWRILFELNPYNAYNAFLGDVWVGSTEV